MKKLYLLIFLFLFSCSNEQKQDDTPRSSELKTQSNAGLNWQIPADWIEEQPTSRMRTAQYRLPQADSDSEDAEIVIFFFGGEGGGVQANIDRWISQFENANRQVSEPVKSEVNGLMQTLVDIKGTYLFKPTPMAPNATEKPGFRMLAAVIEANSGPWFIRFVGPENTVAKWEDSFHTFLESFKPTA